MTLGNTAAVVEGDTEPEQQAEPEESKENVADEGVTGETAQATINKPNSLISGDGVIRKRKKQKSAVKFGD